MRRKPRLKKRDVFIAVLFCALTAAGVLLGIPWLEERNKKPEPRGDLSLRYADETATFDGEAYRLRNELTAILVMGIDRGSGKENAPSYLQYLSGGQADFLRLVVIDPTEKTLWQIEIDRDTMTPITVLGTLGGRVGRRTTQICLSHGFGDGKEQSCELTAEAVSNLLFHVPVKHYAALNLDGVSVLNDLLGGVTVTLEDDFSAFDPAMTQGATLTLQGRQAEIFVRGRMYVGTGTNEARMARQQQYLSQITGLLDQKLRDDRDFAGTLFDALSLYLVTDMSRTALINEVWKARDYSRPPVVKIAGTHQIGDDGYMEFWADEDALKQTVLSLFYTKQ